MRSPAASSSSLLWLQGVVKVLGAVGVLSLGFKACSGANNRCVSADVTSCNECLLLGPDCGWCFQEDFPVEAQSERCDSTYYKIQYAIFWYIGQIWVNFKYSCLVFRLGLPDFQY
nr:PREDICTED: integrin beta-8-like [Latimeria chalumnae]|eukprot:XP_014341185.1 PREDICTED: integrin beta-8-like [Latimeria chalumnae]